VVFAVAHSEGFFFEAHCMISTGVIVRISVF
jgi:hypothetical protein